MIPNHQQFITALTDQAKVRLRFHSVQDGGVLDRICAPLDYGPGAAGKGGQDRYWVWNYMAGPEGHILGLLPPQIVELKPLPEKFTPGQLGPGSWAWSIPRTWTIAG